MIEADDLTMCLAALRDEPYACSAPQLREALAACAAAGFRGLSVWPMHLASAEADGLGPAELATELERAGLSVRMVEAATAWTTGDRAAIEAEAGPLLDLAEALGAEELLAVHYDGELDPQRSPEGLAYLCDLAATRGVRVGLEFLPWSAIADLRSAWALVQRVARPNLGIVLDTWHWQRQPGGPDLATLATIPGDRIHVLQLSDAPAEPTGDLLTETMGARLLPGRGDIDFVSLLDGLDAIGAEPMVAPEVFNPGLLIDGVAEVAAATAAAVQAVLAR